MKKNKKNEEIDKLSLDDDILLFCAFRYALGRRSYVVSTVVQRLILYYNKLSVDRKNAYIREILEAKENDWLGDDFSGNEWRKVAYLFEQKNHHYVKAMFDDNSLLRDESKKITDNKYEIHEAVLMDNKYYSLNMRSYFHSCVVLNKDEEGKVLVDEQINEDIKKKHPDFDKTKRITVDELKELLK